MRHDQRRLEVFIDFESRVNEMFKELIHDRWYSKREEVWTPHTDVIEYDDEIDVYIELPGLDPGNISVQLDKNNLRIYGERHEAWKEGSYQILSERQRGVFARSIVLDEDYRYSIQETKYQNGVFSIHIQKQEIHG